MLLDGQSPNPAFGERSIYAAVRRLLRVARISYRQPCVGLQLDWIEHIQNIYTSFEVQWIHLVYVQAQPLPNFSIHLLSYDPASGMGTTKAYRDPDTNLNHLPLWTFSEKGSISSVHDF